MSRHRKTFGVCRLCGQEKELTFEHVPPRTAFNKHTTYVSIDFMKFMESEDILNSPPKGKKKQGGIGYNSLCSSCNSFLGSEYVPAYKNWVLAGYEIIKKQEFIFAEYTVLNQQPLKILKAIISMFLTINKKWYLKAYPELAEFVRNPELQTLPEKFRVFTYLTNEGGTRYMHHSTTYKSDLGGPVNSTEIAFPPYGYVLTMDFKNDINILNNITGFKEFGISETTDLKLKMFKLPVYSPFSLDYRTKDKMNSDIQKGIKENKEFESKFNIPKASR